jgi:hypothetical protein
MIAKHRPSDLFDHLIATEVHATGDGASNVIDHYVLDLTPEREAGQNDLFRPEPCQ